MDVNMVPAQWIIRKVKVPSPSHKGFLVNSVLGPAQDFIQRLTYGYFYTRAKNDYRRIARYARRMGNEWNHNEALLVDKVEHYLKECEPC